MQEIQGEGERKPGEKETQRDEKRGRNYENTSTLLKYNKNEEHALDSQTRKMDFPLWTFLFIVHTFSSHVRTESL